MTISLRCDTHRCTGPADHSSLVRVNAQAAAVCSDTPTAADRIECIEAATDSTAAILIDAQGYHDHDHG